MHLFCVCLTDGTAKIFFLPPYAAAGIQSHDCIVAPTRKDALPKELQRRDRVQKLNWAPKNISAKSWVILMNKWAVVPFITIKSFMADVLESIFVTVGKPIVLWQHKGWTPESTWSVESHFRINGGSFSTDHRLLWFRWLSKTLLFQENLYDGYFLRRFSRWICLAIRLWLEKLAIKPCN